MIKTVLATLFAGYLTIVVLLYLFQRNLMYIPGGGPGEPGDAGVPEMRAETIVAADGVGTVSWIAPGASDAKVVVLFHGNAGNIADRGFKARHFLDAGFGAALVGYRGFGDNPGSPTEAGLYADGKALLEDLEGKGIAADRIVLYGESMGSGLAVHLATLWADSGNPFAGIILEAPFTSMADAAAYHYSWLPARLLVKDRYDSLTKIDRVNAPVMIIHGDRDRTVPQDLGRKLFSAAEEPKTAIWLEAAGHVDIFDFDVVQPMTDWVRKLP
ncbi:MAG: alpha/beta hydrolase [Rhodospirillales bacterium]